MLRRELPCLVRIDVPDNCALLPSNVGLGGYIREGTLSCFRRFVANRKVL